MIDKLYKFIISLIRFLYPIIYGFVMVFVMPVLRNYRLMKKKFLYRVLGCEYGGSVCEDQNSKLDTLYSTFKTPQTQKKK